MVIEYVSSNAQKEFMQTLDTVSLMASWPTSSLMLNDQSSHHVETNHPLWVSSTTKIKAHVVSMFAHSTP